ncbi:mitochondrion protein [Thelephora terrestris]|uniref:Mitochondrion protein n=1 Tax=Thelephora terrestris TaxID=56493 RepID=A0A9P6HAT3_9AGAM|nr:mitochondrion protein [Thelephora terrestris]
MKIVSQEDLEKHDAATFRGAVEGIAAGLAISLPGSWLLHKRVPFYRGLPIQLKALGIILVVGPCYAIQAERRGVEYDMSTWQGTGKELLDEQEHEERKRWESLSTKDKIGDWALKHQYSLILGSWAASMGVAAAIIMKDRNQSTSQKVVQARMWAQGLTIGVLIAAGILTHQVRAQAAAHRPVDHSWSQVIEEQQREKERIAAASQ